VGLIITSLFKVENEVESFQGVLPFVSRHALGPFAELTEAVHSLGAKIFVQLTAGLGRVAPLRLNDHLVSASAIPHYWNPRLTCRELKIEEVEQIVKAFGNAAEILAAAGVDGVEPMVTRVTFRSIHNRALEQEER
jgi:2-enoate reductase